MDDGNDAKIALRAGATLLMLVVSVFFLSRLSIEGLKHVVPTDVWMDRAGPVETSKTALEAIKLASNDPAPTSIILGSSLSVGINLEIPGVKSANAAVKGDSLTVLSVLTNDLIRTFSRKNRRVSSAVVEFFPPSVSVRTKRNPKTANQKIQSLGVLYEWSDLASHFLTNPVEASKILSVRFLGGLAPQAVGVILNETLYSRARRKRQALTREEMKEEFQEIDEHFNLADDIVDEGQMSEFVSLVEKLKESADATYVYVPPDNFDIWRPTETGEKNRIQSFKLIENLNVPLFRIDSAQFTISDFKDTTHLNETGLKKLSQMLSSMIQKNGVAGLREPARSN